MHKTVTALFISIFLVSCVSSAFAEEKTVTLGGKAGWPALSYTSGVTRGKGRLGQEAIVLSSVLDSSREESVVLSAGEAASDLYLPFDSADDGDGTGNYTVVSSTLLRTGPSKARRGSGAALCNTSDEGLVLRGLSGSMFSTPGESGSFSIEFWLFPSVTENGSILFQWRSSRTSVTGSFYQYIRSSIFRNHVEWTFSNIWTSSLGKPFDVTIAGRKNLIPGVWSHHELSYDAETGLLEYFLDGSTENVEYVTSTGHERGDVYPAVLGAPADVEICSRFSGLIDEFRIRRKAASFDSLETKHAVLERYPASGGRFESQPIDSRALNSTLASVSVVKSEPAGTGTAFFVRSGDNFYRWTETEPAWIPVSPGEKISGVAGRYFQVAANLYPDGSGSNTPSVTSISLNYEEDSPPWPPVRVTARAGDGSVTLSWPASIDFDTAGYLVYYGDHSGEYLESGSPIDAGASRTFTVTGLKNGKLYYFSIAAYDASGPRYPGTLSQETYARPQALRENSNGRSDSGNN